MKRSSFEINFERCKLMFIDRTSSGTLPACRAFAIFDGGFIKGLPIVSNNTKVGIYPHNKHTPRSDQTAKQKPVAGCTETVSPRTWLAATNSRQCKGQQQKQCTEIKPSQPYTDPVQNLNSVLMDWATRISL